MLASSLTREGVPPIYYATPCRARWAPAHACGSSTPRGKTRTMAMTHPAADGVEYQQRGDEDLVAIAKTGDNLAMEYLLNKYKNFVRIKAKSYFLIGADREDIIQEGMIGLYKAVR